MVLLLYLIHIRSLLPVWIIHDVLLKEIFETARTAGSFALVNNSSQNETYWMETYVTYQAQQKVLQAAVSSNKVLERTVFTAEELRDM